MMLGNNIRTLRQRRGLTQEKVAASLGVSYQAVSKWETGANTPDISLLPALAALFDVSIDTLFSLDMLPSKDMFPWADDDVIRVVQLQGRRILAITPSVSSNAPPVEIAFPHDCNQHTQYFRVEVYGHLVTDGSINGDVICHHSIQCSQINGNVQANGDIKVNELNSQGRIVCCSIHDCYKLQADHIECAGNVQAANLTCSQIIYKK